MTKEMVMSEEKRNIVLPTPSQAAWADAEIGVIIHFDMQVFEPTYEFRRRWGYTPDPKIFNPRELDTDQWIAAAKSAGATYAVLVAKHCSGFSLWPTKAHPYSVASTPWRGGKGDIVGDFIKSCRKYNLKPGIYASASCNGYLRVDNPGKVLINDPEFLKKYSTSMEMQSRGSAGGGVWAGPEEQRHYNQVVETQLTELWTNYGKLFEIWFDGGVLPPELGGPDIVPIMRRLQPDAVVFGGPKDWPSLARFVGNERGEAPDPFWSTTGNLEAFDGTSEVTGLGGSPNGPVWACGEADMPNRGQMKAFQGGWFWREGDDQFVDSLDHLVECYFTSVARNCNLLLGMVIDPRGLVPDVDRKRFAEFGERVARIFSKPVARTQGNGMGLTLKLPAGRTPTVLGLMEDIRHGERIRKFVVEARTSGGWTELWRGTCVGHKRLERFEPIHASELRLRVLECVAEPLVREFGAWEAAPELFGAPLEMTRRCQISLGRDKEGMVSISCSNPNLHIRYTIDGSEPSAASPLYTKPFPLRQGGEVKAYACVNDTTRTKTASAAFGVDRSSWKVVSVSLDSPFPNSGHANVAHLLNDDPEYYWHTYHTDKSKSVPPHEVVLDMGREVNVAAFTMQPRSGAGAAPDQCEFHLSEDGTHWKLAATAEFADLNVHDRPRLVKLARPMIGRFLRFVARHAVNDEDYVVVAGVGVVEAQG
jgi:alpha-L-fucosidase